MLGYLAGQLVVLGLDPFFAFQQAEILAFDGAVSAHHDEKQHRVE